MLKQVLEEAILHHSFGTAQTGPHQFYLEAYFSSFPMQPSCEHIAPAKLAPFHQQHLTKHSPNHLCLLLNHFQFTEPQNILRCDLLGFRSSSSPSFSKLTGCFHSFVLPEQLPVMALGLGKSPTHSLAKLPCSPHGRRN